jgi:hypothetical protein
VSEVIDLKNAVYPTNTCFDDALDLLGEFMKHHPELESDLRLVHALCTAPDGTTFAHAWLEDRRQGLALFTGIQFGERRRFMARRDEYRSNFAVQHATEYTVAEAWLHNRTTGHYGPWIERYREFCGGRAVWLPAGCDVDE